MAGRQCQRLVHQHYQYIRHERSFTGARPSAAIHGLSKSFGLTKTMSTLELLFVQLNDRTKNVLGCTSVVRNNPYHPYSSVCMSFMTMYTTTSIALSKLICGKNRSDISECLGQFSFNSRQYLRHLEDIRANGHCAGGQHPEDNRPVDAFELVPTMGQCLMTKSALPYDAAVIVGCLEIGNAIGDGAKLAAHLKDVESEETICGHSYPSDGTSGAQLDDVLGHIETSIFRDVPRILGRKCQWEFDRSDAVGQLYDYRYRRRQQIRGNDRHCRQREVHG